MITVIAVITIQNTTKTDEPAIRKIHEQAFGPEEGRTISDLTIELLSDPTAKPVTSLLAYEKEVPIGHVIFTNVEVLGAKKIKCAILAPLAVLPENQRQGTGTRLVKHGLALLEKSGCKLVFVLGHPEYYPKFGFLPAGQFGFKAPYPIAEKNSNAWMVLELCKGTIGSISGEIRCADALNKPEHWTE